MAYPQRSSEVLDRGDGAPESTAPDVIAPPREALSPGPAYPAASLEDVRHSTFTSFLDLARWTAASLVFIGHLRSPLFLGYGDIDPASSRNLLIKLWYLVTGWHAEAVVVFFVLSGYLVGGQAAAKVSVGRFSPRTYAIDRVSRIYVAFLPALLLTVGLDYAGSHWLAGAGLYDGTQLMYGKSHMAAVTQFMTPATFGYSLLQLQTFFAPPYGSNQPLWSISPEFWFYVAFGLAAAAFVYRRSAKSMALLAATLLIFILLGPGLLLLMGLWLIGVAGAFIPRGWYERPLIALGFFIAVLLALKFTKDAMLGNDPVRYARYYVTAIAFFWLMISMRRVYWRPLVSMKALNRTMADFSFSLYLIHYPLMLFLLSALYATGAFPQIAVGYAPTSPTGLALYLATIGAVYLAAWSFSQATERQTARVRRMMQGVFARRQGA